MASDKAAAIRKRDMDYTPWMMFEWAGSE
ncbi:hypothetical protein IL54_2526 [Sphingobium sp. ba1]|nr:hypothetical protein IL54_2526 [Sphingobium sp. ba1]